MSDKEFLQWIYDRLVNVHKENVYVDYMRKLKSIIKATKKSKVTPNTQ